MRASSTGNSKTLTTDEDVKKPSLKINKQKLLTKKRCAVRYASASGEAASKS
jgi:TATA-binding protein-associated factor Taf7